MTKRNFKSMNDSINTFHKFFFVWVAFIGIMGISTFGAAVYVAHHFITKFW